MNHELQIAARALGASTHVDAFGDAISPMQVGSAGITYLRADLEIALEMLSRLPAGGIKIACGKKLKFTVMLDDNTTVGDHTDLGRATLALAQLLTVLNDGAVQSARA